MTTFKSALALCGLTQADAAEFFGVEPVSIRHWCRATRVPPLEIWQELAELFYRIEDAANRASADLKPSNLRDDAGDDSFAGDVDDPLPGRAGNVAGAMAVLIATIEAS